MLAIAVVAGVLLPTSPAEAQQIDQVEINEIFYHPPCRVNYTPCVDAQTEFIEVHNAGDQPIDIGGWAFVDGVDYTFPLGTVLGADGFVVIADDAATFTAEFGVAADGQWSGGLSNSGERLALADDTGALVDEVTYSDGSDTPGAWAVGADGNGESLSLISADDDDGSSFWWDGAAPTPRAVNANDGLNPSAIVRNFVWTVLPAAADPITVTADLYGGQNVSLQYRVDYPGSTQSIPMTLTGGNTWKADIPATAYGPGDLVRFRILNDGNRVAPRQSESIDWVGTTVADPSVSSTLPVIEWFTSNSNYNNGFNEQESQFYDGVLAHNGMVWDNVGFRARGNIARTEDWTKRNWKFTLPDQHDFFIDGISYGLDSLDLQGGFADEARIREFVGHTVADEMGLVASQVQHVQLRLNGDYFGLHTLQEHPEGGFLRDNDLDNATLFKGARTPEYEAGPTNISPPSSVGFETWDIPDYINMLAAASVIQHNDFAHSNFYSWYDADEHERYEGMIWDLDLSQGIRYAPTSGLTTRLENGNSWSYVWHRWKNQAPIFNQVLSSPYRELYLRRLRTLADEWYGTGRFEQLARATFADISAEWILDTNEWGFWDDQSFTQQGAIDRHSNLWIDQFYAHILAGGPDGDIPGPQPANPDLDLFVDASPSDQRGEHIRIRNNENTAIDVSGWRIGGSANLVLPPGSVLPSNGSAYVVDNDRLAGFRAVTSNLYVLAEYDAPLNDAGGVVDLSDAVGQVHASVAWGAGAPDAGLILNEWNAVSSSNVLPSGDLRFGSITGNGGDWFELVVTEDHLDIRGWELEIRDDGLVEDTLTFSNDDLWADLRAGTIITVAETAITGADATLWEEDPSYSPAAGDWWIHVVAGVNGSGTFITATNFKVSNDDWQLAVYDTAGSRRFGPVGEGIGALAGGVSSSEIGELAEDPGPDIDASSAYGDDIESTFGLPNRFGAGEQDLGPLRPDVGLPGGGTYGDVNCDGRVDIGDALGVLQYSVSTRTAASSCPLAAPTTTIYVEGADVNCDGLVNVADALTIMQYAVGSRTASAVCPLADPTTMIRIGE